jgi:ribonucleoside-diphosphate reductase alpha chain
MGEIQDSIDGIFEALKEGALTMQKGGGVGFDFSTLRPIGSPAHRVGSIASGPVSFMHVWDSMCATLLSTGQRRGAMMATLRCDHPDIENFIHAKDKQGALTHFNLSVLVSDRFMDAVRQGEDWPLVFPVTSDSEDPALKNNKVVLRQWSGKSAEVPCRIHRTVPARKLWDAILQSSYETSEPGVLFIDRINQENNLGDLEQISATNPCGEIPLPPYGACDLGSLNLTAFVESPFTKHARFDFDSLDKVAAIAVRMLDNVIDVSRFPLEKQRHAAQQSRRIGLGITGLADALIMLGMTYGTADAIKVAESIVRAVCYGAYGASIDLAREKGVFPLFHAERFIERPFIRRLPPDIRKRISDQGLRNSHVLAIAPAGTISLLANNVSSGIEPVFALKQRRKIWGNDQKFRDFEVNDFAYDVWQSMTPNVDLPETFVVSKDIAPQAHLEMQAVLQRYIDNAISKTINLPADLAFEAYTEIYLKAYELGLKGCTTYRPSPIRGQILSAEDDHTVAKCCLVD